MASQADAFIAQYAPDAQVASARTGVPWQTILAQWADETGYGTAPAFTHGNNFAGISPGGNVAAYPDQISGLAAYIDTLNQPTYATVRNAGAQGPVAAAEALGNSPWAGSHYDANSTGVPGADLVSILGQTGLDPSASAQLTSTWSDIKNGITGAAGAFVPGLGLIPGASGAISGAAGDIAQGVVNDLVGAIRKPAIMAVALTAAGALVIGGIWTALKPTVQPAIDQAKQNATTAAETAALA